MMFVPMISVAAHLLLQLFATAQIQFKLGASQQLMLGSVLNQANALVQQINLVVFVLLMLQIYFKMVLLLLIQYFQPRHVYIQVKIAVANQNHVQIL